MPATIVDQLVFRPELPDIIGCKDYREQRELFTRIDDILEQGDIEYQFQKLCLARYEKWRESQSDSSDNAKPSPKASDPDTSPPPYHPYKASGGIKQSWINHTRTALRSNIASHLTNTSLRDQSVKLADSGLMRWFCRVNEFGNIRAPSKSTLGRYENWLDCESIRELINTITQQAAGLTLPSHLQLEEPSTQPLNLASPIELHDIWWDGTCLKAPIHYPVDWVLLRDICRTLMKACILIRKQGLKNRMPQPPESFLRDMNNLAMEMTQSRRRKGGKKLRKLVLRKMIKLEKKIARHAQKHRDILDQRWEQSDLSQAQAQQIIDRIDNVIEVLPAAITQARERILGERPVASKDKILSIYETDINVIVRGKAGAEVEFGNVLRLAEQQDGLIIDFSLHRQGVSDNSAKPFAEGVERMIEATQSKIVALWTDRGMESRENVKLLKSKNISNGICPKNPAELQEKLSDPEYAASMKRRASTEGRIGIFKNRIQKGGLRSKGYHNRSQAVAWGVLSHNMWVLARLPQAKEAEIERTESPPEELPSAA